MAERYAPSFEGGLSGREGDGEDLRRFGCREHTWRTRFYDGGKMCQSGLEEVYRRT